MLCAVCAFVLCCLVILAATEKTQYSVAVGEISAYTITAPQDLVDEVTTNKLIEEERAKISPIYEYSQTITDETLNSVKSDFDAFSAARAAAQQAYVADQVAVLQEKENQRAEDAKKALTNDNSVAGDTPATITQTITEEDVDFRPEEIDWQTALSDTEYEAIVPVLPEYITREDANLLFATAEDDLQRLIDSGEQKTDAALQNGIKTEELEDVISVIVREMAEENGTDAERIHYFSTCFYNRLKANMVFNEEATKAAQDAAAAQVETVTYKRGQNIVVRGELVTQEQYSVLKQSGLIDQTRDISIYLPIFLYVLCVFVLYMTYLLVFHRKIARNLKTVAILSILTVLAMIFTSVVGRIAPNMIVLFTMVILVAALISPRTAVAYGVFLSLLTITVSSTQMAFFTEYAARWIAMSIGGSVLASVVVRRVNYRAALLLAGMATSIPCALIYLIMLGMGNIATDAFGTYLLWSVGGGVFCGVVSIGLLPVFEILFKVTTPAKLIELADPRHPLLKRLLLEAPGTYHHSLFVGNLAENACDAIGANSLLARVGAYYHDIGKLENPQYFVENQRNNLNLHDDLPPEQSAQIIMEHVRNGRRLAEKAKLPTEIINLIAEHHGDTLVAYFYHKAKQTDPQVRAEKFRYQGPKPSSKESAVLMLADSVEAAVRSLDQPEEEKLRDLVFRIVRGKYDDGQLNNTALTFRDLTTVAKAFVETYRGVQHERIKYPENMLLRDDDECNNL